MIIREPEFTAYDINELSKLARRDSYYQNVKDFVERFLRDSILWKDMSEKQQRWLWGIKKDLEEIL